MVLEALRVYPVSKFVKAQMPAWEVAVASLSEADADLKQHSKVVFIKSGLVSEVVLWSVRRYLSC